MVSSPVSLSQTLKSRSFLVQILRHPVPSSWLTSGRFLLSLPGGSQPHFIPCTLPGGPDRGGGIFRDVRAGGRSLGQVAGMGAWSSCTPCFRDAHWSLERSFCRDKLGLEKDLGNRAKAGMGVLRSKGCLRGSGDGVRGLDRFPVLRIWWCDMKSGGGGGSGSAGQLWAYLQQEEGFPARCPLSLASAYVTIGRVTDSQMEWGGGIQP